LLLLIRKFFRHRFDTLEERSDSNLLFIRQPKSTTSIKFSMNSEAIYGSIDIPEKGKSELEPEKKK